MPSVTAERLVLIGILAALGAGWGMTQPLSKIAVSTGYQPFGLVFWQLAIGAVVLGAYTHLRGKALPLHPAALRRYLVIALIGTILPNSASYTAIQHLPSGLISILISTVPMWAFPIALLLALDRFDWVRFLGLVAGLAGVLLIVAPEASLPDRAVVAFIPLALIAPLFYGLEGNVVAKWGTAGVGPIRLLYGASLVGMVIAFPLAVVSGQFIDPRPPWTLPDLAVLLNGVIHATVYTIYVWLVGRAGSVFAAQVSYLVTGFGVIWAMLILGERFSPFVWAALAAMFLGLFLVQPRPVAGRPDIGKDTA